MTSVTVDLGPTLRQRAETAGTNAIKRPMHIGRLAVHLWRGSFVVDDLIIEGHDAEVAPIPRGQAHRRLDAVEHAHHATHRLRRDPDDRLGYVRRAVPGRLAQLPEVHDEQQPPKSAWTTTLEYVRASRGQFTYEDHGTPWSTIARNLDVTVSRPASEYRGQARFSNGTVAIQNYVPMRADMSTTFRIVDGKIVLDRIDLRTDGAQTQLTGVVDARAMARADLSHQIEDRLPDREGHLVRARQVHGCRHWRFHRHLPPVQGAAAERQDAHGPRAEGRLRQRDGRGQRVSLRQPARLGALGARADGSHQCDGDALRRQTRSSATRWRRSACQACRRTATFDAAVRERRSHDVHQCPRAEGHPARRPRDGTEPPRVAARQATRCIAATVSCASTPPPGTELMSLRMPIERIEAQQRLGKLWGPFDNTLPTDPIAGRRDDHVCVRSPTGSTSAPSRFATPSTYVEFEGRTAYGDNSRIPFHVSSADWQESDRLLAGLMTAFGSPTNAIPIGGLRHVRRRRC